MSGAPAGNAEVLEDPHETARLAAARAGVTIDTVDDIDGVRSVVELLCAIWGVGTDTPPMRPELLRSLALAGNYVAAASAGGLAIGASVGFLGVHDGAVHLHSHITGILEAEQGRHVGYALKQHQRAWALERGIERIEWTFDPLVRRNGFFNLTKLGAEIVRYHPHLFGAMADGINGGDETDRGVVAWSLGSPRVVSATSALRVEADIDALRADGATAMLSVAPDGAPSAGERGRDVLLVQVPVDIVRMRRADPGLAKEWRYAVRETMGAAIGDGYVADTMTRSGWYVLRRPASS